MSVQTCRKCKKPLRRGDGDICQACSVAEDILHSVRRDDANTAYLVEKLRQAEWEIENLRRHNELLLLKAENQSRQGGNRTTEELKARLKDLVFLCHPDKHGNAARATRVTQWLNSLRDTL